MPTLREWQLRLDVDDVLRAQGGDAAEIRSRRSLFVEIAQRALAEGTPLLQPVVHYRQLAVESLSHQRLLLSNGDRLSGPLVTQHIGPATEVVAAACSIGHALEERAAQVMTNDQLYGLALDGVGTAAVEMLATAACHHFEERAELVGQRVTIPISPGLEGWPLFKGQKQIFSLMNTEEINIRLLQSGVMSPRKSLSFVIGLGSDVSTDGVPCDYCNLRDRCRFRPA